MPETASPSRRCEEIPAEDRWNLDDIYPSLDAWRADMAKLETDLQRMVEAQGSLSQSPRALLEVLRLDDRIDATAQRVWWYVALMHDEDLRDNEVAARKQEVTALLSKAGTAAAWMRKRTWPTACD